MTDLIKLFLGNTFYSRLCGTAGFNCTAKPTNEPEGGNECKECASSGFTYEHKLGASKNHLLFQLPLRSKKAGIFEKLNESLVRHNTTPFLLF